MGALTSFLSVVPWDVVTFVVTFFGGGTVVAFIARTFDYRVAQRFLRLKRGDVTTIVVARSRVDLNGPMEHRRSLLSLDTLQAVTSMSSAIARIGIRPRQIQVAMDDRVHREVGDLVLIGGPRKNEVSKVFLKRFNIAHPNLQITRSENEHPMRICIGGEKTIELHQEYQQDGSPRFDLGLIVVWLNPFITPKRRAVMCCGFTSAGTKATVDYLVGDLNALPLRRHLHREGHLPPRWSRRWPCLVAVIKYDFQGGLAGIGPDAQFYSFADTQPLFMMTTDGERLDQADAAALEVDVPPPTWTPAKAVQEVIAQPTDGAPVPSAADEVAR